MKFPTQTKPTIPRAREIISSMLENGDLSVTPDEIRGAFQSFIDTRFVIDEDEKEIARLNKELAELRSRLEEAAALSVRKTR